MTMVMYLLPVALGLGALGLVAFFWTLNSGQYDDLDGAAQRILDSDEDSSVPSSRPASKSELNKVV